MKNIQIKFKLNKELDKQMVPVADRVALLLKCGII
jgi:hypothetical protein